MSSVSAGKRRVLVVDDDQDTLDYLSALLVDNGYEVRTAASHAAALSQLGEFQADAVLMDVMMPGKSGLDLLVKLRSSPQWSDLSVIVVTGDDRVLEDHGKSYLSAHNGLRGPDAELGKPVDPEALLRVLEASAVMR
jgi:two-component system alkaline phosphatase synthesis response regulator PhoP